MLTPAEKPILFSGEMVRAILDGRKTQTRRVVKLPIEFIGGGGSKGPEWPDPAYWGYADEYGEFWTLNDKAGTLPGDSRLLRRPYQSGVHLWVREVHWRNGYLSRWCGSEPIEPHWITNQPLMGQERAMRDCFVKFDNPGDPHHWQKAPSIHMPRWASRITLEITEVRAERLQSISIEDCFREGLSDPDGKNGWAPSTAIGAFAKLWDRINGKKHPWESNPWLWVLTFKRIDPC